MATPKETVTFDVHDAKVQPLLTDTAGGSATYAVAVDVPGIAQVSLDPEFITAELKGDARTIARKGKTGSFNVSATYSVMSMDVLKVLYGGTVTPEVAPESVHWILEGDNSVPYFLLSFLIDDLSTGIGSLHVSLYKAQVTGGSLFDQSTDEFGQRSFQVSAIPTLATDEIIKVEMFTAQTPLPTAAIP